MSPISPPASAALPAEAAVAERLLQDGEIVILAIKPSRWFVVLVSLPVLWAALLVGLVATIAGQAILGATSKNTVWAICAAAAALRLLLACVQWAGRWYILTNFRLVQVRGLFRTDVTHHDLVRVAKTFVHLGATGRVLPSVGSLLFDTLDGADRPPPWIHILRPAEIEEIVDQAIRHARRSPGS
jgi:hypothetical protein